ncbi:3-galactosyl-N-acetylglucosaminide 4-alpha-L-fucosyltransferase FUT3-like [Rhinophrynus dorsalis]
MALKAYVYKNMICILPIVFLVFLLSLSRKQSHIIPRNLKCQEKEILQDPALNMPNPIHKSEKDLLMLVWVFPFGEYFPVDTCQRVHGISGCKMTADRRFYNIADVVVIHHFDIMYDKNTLPQQPRPHYQRWIWYNMEPPLILKNLHFVDNLINMTWTFRLDSDIFTPYARIEPLKEPQNFTIPAKSKLVSWAVSQWYPGSPRIAYYEELKKHITIDVYGKKHKKLSRDDFTSTISQYKFYLAFENSKYKDYITEKFWLNSFNSWTVPVVLGTSRKNYELFMPGDAFIHVDDFSSPKELANFLIELDKDDERYRKYFNWRSHFKVWEEPKMDHQYCKVCSELRKAPYYQVIPSVAKWFLDDV